MCTVSQRLLQIELTYLCRCGRGADERPALILAAKSGDVSQHVAPPPMLHQTVASTASAFFTVINLPISFSWAKTRDVEDSDGWDD